MSETKATFIYWSCTFIVMILLLNWLIPAQKPIILETHEDMTETHLHVEQFGPVHKVTDHPDGTQSEVIYWEAYVTDDRNRHVYFIRCTPELESKWKAYFQKK